MVPLRCIVSEHCQFYQGSCVGLSFAAVAKALGDVISAASHLTPEMTFDALCLPR